MRKNDLLIRVAVGALAVSVLSVVPEAVSAQLANASASTIALSGNNTATVRGFGAISVNPAGLAMPGSGFSLTLVPVQVRSGFGPVGPRDLSGYRGKVVPVATKEAWMTAIEAAGVQVSSVGVDISAVALTVGNFGFQFSTMASASAIIPTGVAEAVLFGNAGRDPGNAADLDLTGLGGDGFAVSTAAFSYAFPVGPAKLGLTGKYIVGHGLALATTRSGSLSSDPLRMTLDMPVVGPCSDESLGGCTQDYWNAGSGIGWDVGFMMGIRSLTIGASIENIVNTFEWDVSRLSYRLGSVLFEQGTSESTFDETSYASAPATLRTQVGEYTFKPTLRVGVAMDFPVDLTVSGDIHRRLSDDGIALTPKSHVGLGAEFRGLRILHLRAGAAVISGGTQFSGGASLVLGPINISSSWAVQDRDLLPDVALGQFALSIGNH